MQNSSGFINKFPHFDLLEMKSTKPDKFSFWKIKISPLVIQKFILNLTTLDICWKWMKFQWIFRYAFMLQWTIKKEDEMEIICGNYISSAAEKGYDSDIERTQFSSFSWLQKILLWVAFMLHNNLCFMLLSSTTWSNYSKTLINSKALDELSTFRKHLLQRLWCALSTSFMHTLCRYDTHRTP